MFMEKVVKIWKNVFPPKQPSHQNWEAKTVCLTIFDRLLDFSYKYVILKKKNKDNFSNFCLKVQNNSCTFLNLRLLYSTEVKYFCTSCQKIGIATLEKISSNCVLFSWWQESVQFFTFQIWQENYNFWKSIIILQTSNFVQGSDTRTKFMY